MNPHRRIFDRCRRRIFDNNAQGQTRDDMLSVFEAIRTRPLAECAMMRVSDFANGQNSMLFGMVGRLNYLASNPEAVLDASGIMIEDGRPVRVSAESVFAVLDGRPINHPLTGEVLQGAGDRIQPCFDLRPEALIDKLCAERDLKPGPGLPGVLMICPDNATAQALAAHMGWSLTTDEPHEADPAITRGAIMRAMRGGVPVFAALDALPDGLHLDEELVVLHPEFTAQQDLGNRAQQIVARICTDSGQASYPKRSEADLLRMASCFHVDEDHEIVSRGKGLWAISRGSGSTLNTDFEWEYEPMPSSREDDYLERNRFTLEEAFAHLDEWIARSKNPAPSP